MLSAKFLLVVIVTLWFSLCDFHFEAYGDDSGNVACVNSPCQELASPPPPPGGYSIYGVPPPPHEAGQSKCPPTAPGVQCCTPPAPSYNITYGYEPPNPYTYVPYGGGEASASLLRLPILVPLMMLASSLCFLL